MLGEINTLLKINFTKSGRLLIYVQSSKAHTLIQGRKRQSKHSKGGGRGGGS